MRKLVGVDLQDNDDYEGSLLDGVTAHAAHAIT
jgi:hypothetical protein